MFMHLRNKVMLHPLKIYLASTEKYQCWQMHPMGVHPHPGAVKVHTRLALPWGHVPSPLLTPEGGQVYPGQVTATNLHPRVLQVQLPTLKNTDQNFESQMITLFMALKNQKYLGAPASFYGGCMGEGVRVYSGFNKDAVLIYPMALYSYCWKQWCVFVIS